MSRLWSVTSLFAFSAALFGAAFAHAQDEKKPAKPEKPVAEEEAKEFTAADKEKVSYGIGFNQGKKLAEAFKQSGAELDAETVAKGLLDGLKGEKSKFEDEQIEAAFKAFQGEIERKQKAAAENTLKAGKAYLEKNAKKEGVKVTKSGIQYEVMKAGKGGQSPKKTDTVTTHYHGTLIDGTVFDSSVSRKQPAQFRLDQVIKGWTEILQLMKVGDKWKVTIPSDLAYGANPRPGGPIGPNAVLVFEIELISIDDADDTQ
ncbi:MAG: FKBP-type peptidyl-prolyl cis-trans isomerase [Planctomycetaceae bacterium]|nr:FKBP-type peptidyl-prolyl cis-trans isomerase [Planctomycetaceae bacterium]